MFSKACEYGIRATIFIAHQSEQHNKVSLQDVADAIDSPLAFTAKTLQLLAKNNLIQSVKGAGGGYKMTEHQLANVNLENIVVAIDGKDVYTKCGLGLKTCNEKKPCPLHFQFKEIRNKLHQTLCTTAITDLSKQLHHKTFLKTN